MARPDGLTISAVIPTFDRGALAVRAVESALAQTRPPDEIVVIDDGSGDDTAARLAAFGDAVRLVRQDHAGCSAARNRGVREARGEWIAFLDSDDVWTEGHLEAVARAVRATGGGAAFYFSDTLRARREEPRSLWTLSEFAVDPPHELTRDGADWVLRPRQPMMLQSSVFSRATLLAAGGFDEDLPRRSDTHLFFVAALGAPVCAVTGIGAEMTGDDASRVRLTRAFPASSETYLESTVRLYEDVLDAWSGAAPGRRRVLRWRLAHARWNLAKRRLAEGRIRDGARLLLGAVGSRPGILGAKAARAIGRVMGRGSADRPQ